MDLVDDLLLLAVQIIWSDRTRHRNASELEI